MKRAMAAGRTEAPAAVRLLAQEAALGLLARSIAFGHERLAVIRLLMAVHTGVEVPAEHWRYCRACGDRAFSRNGNRELIDLLAEAITAAAAPYPLHNTSH